MSGSLSVGVAIRRANRVLEAYRAVVLRRAQLEAYRAWRDRRPWRWVPTGTLRAALFGLFGRAWRIGFADLWVREYVRTTGAPAPDDVPGSSFLLLAGTTSSPRAYEHGLQRLSFDARQVAPLIDELQDPDDPVALAVTSRCMDSPIAPAAHGRTIAPMTEGR